MLVASCRPRVLHQKPFPGIFSRASYLPTGVTGTVRAFVTPPRPMWKHALLTTAILAGIATLAGVVVVYGGLYDMSATSPHIQPVFTVLEKAMHASVQLRARDIQAPPGLDDPATLQSGAVCFRQHCVQCHGGPGVAPDEIGKGMQPIPGSLVSAARDWTPGELYWITRHGLKMTGMPAWEYRLADQDLWALVGFLQRLPLMSPATYATVLAPLRDRHCPSLEEVMTRKGSPPPEGKDYPKGDAEQGRIALSQYACTSCHVIPGVTGGDIHVGPPLNGWARRQWIAGELPNTRANLIAWLRHPQRIDPLTAMPDLGVTQQHAENMAAYLGSLN